YELSSHNTSRTVGGIVLVRRTWRRRRKSILFVSWRRRRIFAPSSAFDGIGQAWLPDRRTPCRRVSPVRLSPSGGARLAVQLSGSVSVDGQHSRRNREINHPLS